jgi:hypothetical protein
MKTALALALALAGGAALLPLHSAEARAARCVVASNGVGTYRGPCDFLAERGGSFSVAPPRGRSFPGGVTAISVAVEDPGVAEVRGLTAQGINSRWGTAQRSRRDRACWVGSDFTVCAY